MNEIVLEKDMSNMFNWLCIITKKTLDVLFAQDNWSDLVALYFFIYKKCKEQSTNQPWITNSYIQKWLWWWEARLKKAKSILEDLEIIELIRDRNDKKQLWKIFIRLKYIVSENFITKSEWSNAVIEKARTTETQPWLDIALGLDGTNAWSNININAWSNIKEMLEEETQIPNKEKEVNSNWDSSSLWGNTDNQLTDNMSTDNKWEKTKKSSVKKVYSYPTYEEIVLSYWATELNKVINSMIEDLYIQQNLTIKDIWKIREEIIKLSLKKFVNVFYIDHEWAYHWSGVVVSDMIKFIWYFQNNPDKEIKSLIGRIRTWLTHKF